MVAVGRLRELREVEGMLDRAARGSGGVLVVTGPAGVGKTTLVDAAAERASALGFEVLRGVPAPGQHGRLVWVQFLRDIGVPDEIAVGLLADPGPLDLDHAARQLASGPRRLIVVDDLDHGGRLAVEMLAVVAGRVVAGSTAVLATSATPLGVGRELALGGLDSDELSAVVGPMPPDAAHALWVASHGLPGVAKELASTLDDSADPIVHLALNAVSTADFLVVDGSLVRLLELAVSRASGAAHRARVLARLAYELLGDASARPRRQALADEALELARSTSDTRVLAEILDARLHALWDPQTVHDRLATGQEIVELARTAGDETLERKGLFWRFVALMELGRVAEAESVLAAFERAAAAAGAGNDLAMATARHGMLAALRGRFDEAERIAEDVRELGRRSGLADTDRLPEAIRVMVMVQRDLPAVAAAEDLLRDMARRLPGHFAEADFARVLTMLGREAEASAELERVLSRVLTGSGPRWMGAMAHLAFVACRTGNADAAADIYDRLLAYRGRLVVLGGANHAWEPVSHYLGLLAARLGKHDDSVAYLEEAQELEEEIGALPSLAHTLAALADTLTARSAAGDPERASDVRRRARSIAERLGMTVLLNELARPADEWTLDRDGDDWLLSAGDERARIRDSRGMHYLRALLAAPGHDIAALDLVAGGAGLVATIAGPVLDDTAREAYRARLATLDAELDAADQAGDGARGARLASERQALLDELRRASGLGGRPRRSAPEAERARVNVTRTLRTVLDRIAAAAPRAAAHLRASIRTGQACRYQPGPGGPARWHV